MKTKLFLCVLFVLSLRVHGQKESTTQKISLQIEIGSYLGKLYNLHTVSGVFENDGKGITPVIKVGVTYKKLVLQAGFTNQIHHTFDLKPAYATTTHYKDSMYGPLDLQKKMGCTEWQFMIGRVFDIKQGKLQLITSIGYSFARLTQGKDEFRSSRPLVFVPYWGTTAPSGLLFSRKFDALLIDAKAKYNFSKHWYASGDVQFRALLKYITTEEIDEALNPNRPTGLFYRKFINVGLGIGYSF